MRPTAAAAAAGGHVQPQAGLLLHCNNCSDKSASSFSSCSQTRLNCCPGPLLNRGATAWSCCPHLTCPLVAAAAAAGGAAAGAAAAADLQALWVRWRCR
jgi:hypothetical protein